MKWTGFILFILFFPALVVYAEEIQEVIPAIKLEESAKIDGVLDDAVWEKAFHDKRFFLDEQLLTDQPFRERQEETEVWVFYNDEALFIGFKCYEKEVLYQYIQQKSVGGSLGEGSDDTVGFALVVDVNKHYDREAQYWYILNPAGAYWFQPAVGRATKEELTGQCEAATKIEEGYWTTEIKLYWSAVDYPQSDKPYDMLLKPDRRHKWPGMPARLAHYPKTFNGSDTRLNFCRFTGFLPPRRGIETKFVPNLFGGWSEKEKWERRPGLDFRIRPTSQTNIFLTVNPDYTNIEQYVGRIDPMYGPQMLEDYRYIFQEGAQFLKIPPFNFYSRAIEDIDVGFNAFGKVKGFSLAGLGTFYRGGNHNLVFRGYGNVTAKNHLGLAYIGQRKTENSVFWSDFSRVSSWYEIKGDFAQSWAFAETKGRKYWTQGSLFKPGWRGQLQVFATDENYVANLGFTPFIGIKGSNLFLMHERAWEEGKKFYVLWGQFEASNKYNGEIFRRTADVLCFHRRGEHGVLIELWGGRYGRNRDLLLFFGPWLNQTNKQKFAKVWFTIGQREGEDLFQVDPSFAFEMLKKKLRGSVATQLLWYPYPEFQYQNVTTLNYDLTQKWGVGSRFIWNKNGKNLYFALHRSGFKGAEFFIILGDPNAPKFQKRLVGKVVMVMVF